MLPPMRSRGISGYVVGCAAGMTAAMGWLNGCQRPLDGDEGSTAALEQSLIESVRREIDAVPADADRAPLITTQPPSDVEQELRDRLPELEAMADRPPRMASACQLLTDAHCLDDIHEEVNKYKEHSPRVCANLVVRRPGHLVAAKARRPAACSPSR